MKPGFSSLIVVLNLRGGQEDLLSVQCLKHRLQLRRK